MLTLKQMKPHLEGLGFVPTKTQGLFYLKLPNRFVVYCDYRTGIRNTYAYFGDRLVGTKRLKIIHVIRKIERRLIYEQINNRNKLTTYMYGGRLYQNNG